MEDSKTTSEIVVNPDGSRALVVTMQFGGAVTEISIEISKPTEFVNDSRNMEYEIEPSKGVSMTQQ